MPARSNPEGFIAGVPAATRKALLDLASRIRPSTWTAPTLTNSWANVGGANQVAQYRKVGDMVELRGVVATGSTATAAFTLPAGFRPPATIELATVNATATPTAARISISSAGVVTLYCSSITAISLDAQFSTIA